MNITSEEILARKDQAIELGIDPALYECIESLEAAIASKLEEGMCSLKNILIQIDNADTEL